jgi:protein-tyrosine phosphatase
MWTELHWVEGPWPGKLALTARPRGGDWLEEEMAAWRRAGIDIVLSLLTPEEEQDLDLLQEAQEAKALGIKFYSLPIPDRQVPNSESEVSAILDRLDADLTAGKNIAVHCRQGVGRTGLVAACLLVAKGVTPEAAVKTLSAARGTPVPETVEQRRWIDHYAAVLLTVNPRTANGQTPYTI